MKSRKKKEKEKEKEKEKKRSTNLVSINSSEAFPVFPALAFVSSRVVFINLSLRYNWTPGQ